MITALSLALLALPTAPGDLLQRVPDEAFALWTCGDVSVTLEQIQRNDIVRLLGEEDGQPLREVMYEFWPGSRRDLDGALALGQAVTGEVVAFGMKEGYGILAVPAPDHGPVLEILRAMATHLDVQDTREIGGATVEFRWPQVADGEEIPDYYSRIAIIDHPNFVGMVQNYGPVEATVQAILAPDGVAAAVVSGLKKATAAHGPAGQVEVFVDFTPFAEEAAQEMKRAGQPFMMDPSELLGLEETNFYMTASLLPGTNVDMHGHLAIPSGGLLADLADTFQPLPSDLLGAFPKEATGAHALNWDLVAFYDRILEALRESEQGSAADQIEGMAGSGTAMTGVDLEEQFFRQLDGLFGVFYTPPAEPVENPLDDDAIFSQVGLVIGVGSGMEMLDTFEALMETFGALDYFNEEQIEGIEVRLFSEAMGDEDIDGGLAFAPKHLVATAGRHPLDGSLGALAGKGSALDGTRLKGIFDGRSGACYVTAARLGFLRQLLEQKGMEEMPEGLESLFDLYLVDSARRTPTGFEFRAGLE